MSTIQKDLEENILAVENFEQSKAFPLEHEPLRSLSEASQPDPVEEQFIEAAYEAIRVSGLYRHISNELWDSLAEQWGKDAYRLWRRV